MRHIITKAIITKENKIIPFWELHPFEYFENVNNVYYDDALTYLQNVIYDLENKTFTVGIPLEYNNNADNSEYKVGEECYFEISSRKLLPTKIKNVLFENFTSYILFGIQVGSCWKDKFKNIEFKDDELYWIKEYNPTYVLEDDTKVKNSFKLFKKYGNNL